VELEVELEEAVLAGQELVLGGDPPLGLDRALHDLQVGVPRVPGGEQRHLRLEQPPGLEHAADLAHPQVALAAQDLPGHDRVEHDRAAARAGAHRDHAGLGEQLERLAHRRPGDLHLLGQRALRGQLVPGCRSPSVIRSAIWATASSKVRRVCTGEKARAGIGRRSVAALPRPQAPVRSAAVSFEPDPTLPRAPVARRAWRAFAERDADATVAVAGEDVVWRSSRAATACAATRRSSPPSPGWPGTTCVTRP
jgi:hypothetical protein